VVVFFLIAYFARTHALALHLAQQVSIPVMLVMSGMTGSCTCPCSCRRVHSSCCGRCHGDSPHGHLSLRWR
jgi:hypothetical protein